MRIRTVKPAFFKDEELADLPPLTRLLFQGLWLMADRDGRLEDRPRFIKAEVLPYDDCDVDQMLTTLAEKGFIHRYEAEGRKCIFVPGFKDHQRITGSEAEYPSQIPPMPGEPIREQLGNIPATPRMTGMGKGSGMGKGKVKAGVADPATIPIPEDLKAHEGPIRDWLGYKREKGQGYKGLKGLEALWRAVRAIPGGRVREAVDHSMANNYMGLFPAKGGGNAKPPSNQLRTDGKNAQGDRADENAVTL